MAETQNGNAYYEAGTINEQLEDYEVYEENGRLYLNKEAADPESAVSFDSAAMVIQGTRPTPTNEEIGDFDETLLYRNESDQLVMAERSDSSNNPDADGAPNTVVLGDFSP